MKKRTGMFFALLSLVTPLKAWEGSVLLEEGMGKLQGYAQTPRGGDYNTTSMNRPSFKEIGRTQDDFARGEIELHYQYVWAFVNYFHLTPADNTLLANDLLTHSRFIPASSPFEMNVSYNWYQLGLGFDSFDIFSTWRIAPYLAANWVKYHYGFSSPNAYSHRDFNLLSVTAGLKVEHYFSANWLLDADAEVTLPVSELEIFNASIGLNYCLPLGQHFVVRPRVSVGMIYLDYEDLQNVPNHIRYQSAPYAALSLILLAF